MKLLTNHDLQKLSILADRHGDDRVFALCAKAYGGDTQARQTLTKAVAARKARPS